MRLTALASLLTLAGCSGPARWVKEGATQTDWANDHQWCELYAKQMNGNTSWSSGFSHGLLVQGCLEERGWVKAH